MTQHQFKPRARPARPGALGRLAQLSHQVVIAIGAMLLITACTGQGPTRNMQPAPAATPPALPDTTEPTPVTPTQTVIDPVDGQHERRAPWRLVAATGTDLIVEVQAGGAPCDAVTGADVTEDTQTVSLTIWTGRTPGANCPGQPALLGTFWIRVPLTAPLADRNLQTT